MRRRIWKVEDGSFVVEAALVLPIFMMVIISMVYIIQGIFLYRNISNATYSTAISLSPEAHFDNTKSVANIRSIFLEYSDEDIEKSVGLRNGLASVSLNSSKYMKYKDSIEVVAKYDYKIPTLFFKNYSLKMVKRSCVRGFTGNIELKDMDNMVYMTKNGRVYHTYLDCTYLRIITQKVKLEDVSSYRNSSGGKYYECKFCDDQKEDNVEYVFISKYGTSYHYSSGCSTIQRDIKPLRLSEVTGLKLCEKCNKRVTAYE